MTSEETRALMVESERQQLRSRIAGDMRWLRRALDEIESSADADYVFSDDTARNAAQHLVSIAAASARLTMLLKAYRAEQAK